MEMEFGVRLGLEVGFGFGLKGETRAGGRVAKANMAAVCHCVISAASCSAAH